MKRVLYAAVVAVVASLLAVVPFSVQARVHAPAAVTPVRAAPDCSHVAAVRLPLRKILIFGDSITARTAHNYDRGEVGWFEWGYRKYNKRGTHGYTTGPFKFSAVGRSRYAAVTGGQDRPSFYKRLGDVRKYKPTAIIVAGGVVDTLYKDRRQAIAKFYTRLAKVLKQNHIDPCNVYAFVPRPSQLAKKIPAIVRSEARAIGAQYVDVPAYPKSQAYDGLHPSSKAAKMIWKTLMQRSDLGKRLR